MQRPWRPKRGDVVIRHPRREEIKPILVRLKPKRVRPKSLASPIILAYGFALLIAVGTLLLSLPFSNNQNQITPFMDAFFTATSAATVTGLIVQDTSLYWSQIGQGIILALIFVGGLGFMTGATFLFIVIGKRITLANRLLMKESLGLSRIGGLVRLTRNIVLVALTIQIIGFGALYLRLYQDLPPMEAAWQAVFHSVSAFNNAGFTILPQSNSLGVFQKDAAVLGLFAILIILGSISYVVLADVFRYRRFRLFTLNTKLVLVVVGFLLVLGTLVIFLAEYTNPDTLGPIAFGHKAMNAFFLSVSGRTAGFVTIGFGTMRQHTDFFIIGLMFIGGASASTAGGIKVNTFAIILVTLLATMRGKENTNAFGREIPFSQVHRALLIGALAAAFVFLVAFLMAFSEPEIPFVELLFESVSAFGTVGMTTGKIGLLSTWGQLILAITMFIGRIGPLTLALMMARSERKDAYRYAQERVTIG